MKIRYFRSLWGAPSDSLSKNLSATKDAGFDGIEFIAPARIEERRNLRSELDSHGLDFILQLGTGEGTGPAIGPESPLSHLKDLEREMSYVEDLQPILANSHTGRDIFSFEDNLQIFQRACELEAFHGVELLHEVHRGRATGNVPATLGYLRGLPGLFLTADLSHWTCAHESLLEDQAASMEVILPRVKHIHARVGDSQRPQVDDPLDKRNAKALEAHMRFWKSIVRHRQNAGADLLTVTVEFGPPPYFLGDADPKRLWEINCSFREYLSRELSPL